MQSAAVMKTIEAHQGAGSTLSLSKNDAAKGATIRRPQNAPTTSNSTAWSTASGPSRRVRGVSELTFTGVHPAFIPLGTRLRGFRNAPAPLPSPNHDAHDVGRAGAGYPHARG